MLNTLVVKKESIITNCPCDPLHIPEIQSNVVSSPMSVFKQGTLDEVKTVIMSSLNSSPWAKYENPPPPPLGIFKDSDFCTPVLYDYSISACLHSKYWGIKKILGHQTYAPPPEF